MERNVGGRNTRWQLNGLILVRGLGLKITSDGKKGVWASNFLPV